MWRQPLQNLDIIIRSLRTLLPYLLDELLFLQLKVENSLSNIVYRSNYCCVILRPLNNFPSPASHFHDNVDDVRHKAAWVKEVDIMLRLQHPGDLITILVQQPVHHNHS